MVRKPREGRLRDRLMSIFSDFLRLYMKHADLLRLVLMESIRSASDRTGDSSNLVLFQDAIRALIEEAKADGSVRVRYDPGDCAAVLVAIFYQTVLTGATDADESEMLDDLQRKFDMAWEGIADE